MPAPFDVTAAPESSPAPPSNGADAEAAANETVTVLLGAMADVLDEQRATRAELRETRAVVEALAAELHDLRGAAAAAAAAPPAPPAAAVSPMAARLAALKEQMVEQALSRMTGGAAAPAAPPIPAGMALVPSALVPFIRGCARHAGRGLAKGCTECIAAVEHVWADFIR